MQLEKAVCDTKNIHVNTNLKKANSESVPVYIRTGDMGILNAKFYRVDVLASTPLDRQKILLYIDQATDGDNFISLIHKRCVTFEEFVATKACPSYLEKKLDDGWVYCSLFNTVDKKRSLWMFKKVVYQTILHKGDRCKVVVKDKPITDQTV